MAAITEPVPCVLRDGTAATLVPYNSIAETPECVVECAHALLNGIIREGNTYVQREELTRKQFEDYYFPNFVAVLLKGVHTRQESLQLTDCPSSLVVGCFYVKPNYPGRSNHVCNAGFIVNNEYRGQGAGTVMGTQYLSWAPQLGYKSSVFNLVYSNNVASIRIWDKLGFTRIGVVPNAGLMAVGDKEQLCDAIIFGYQFK